MDCFFGVISRKSLPNQRSQKCFKFSPESFIVSGFAFRTIICFELICTYGVRHGSRRFYLHIDVQLFLVQ